MVHFRAVARPPVNSRLWLQVTDSGPSSRPGGMRRGSVRSWPACGLVLTAQAGPMAGSPLGVLSPAIDGVLGDHGPWRRSAGAANRGPGRPRLLAGRSNITSASTLGHAPPHGCRILQRRPPPIDGRLASDGAGLLCRSGPTGGASRKEHGGKGRRCRHAAGSFPLGRPQRRGCRPGHRGPGTHDASAATVGGIPPVPAKEDPGLHPGPQPW